MMTLDPKEFEGESKVSKSYDNIDWPKASGRSKNRIGLRISLSPNFPFSEYEAF